MSERPRLREVLGTTSTACPDCGGGPMVVTRSQRTRRVLDRLNPRFDPDVVHREVCTACSARFPISDERLSSAAPAPEPVSEPTPVPEIDPEPAEDPEKAPEPQPEPAAAPDPQPVPAADPPPTRAASAAARTTPPGRSYLAGHPTPVGAGRRSGPVRRPEG